MDFLLDFERYGGGSHPVQYTARYEGHEYYIRFRSGFLTISKDDQEVFGQDYDSCHPDYSDNAWNDEETNVLLHLISEAVRKKDFSSLSIPEKGNELKNHPFYRKGPFPKSA